MRKLNKKGFTLVEIVIVIVIIAILAAMLVPALTQWIDKSKKKTFTSACGTIKTAVLAQAADKYAESGVAPATAADLDVSIISDDVGKTVVKTGSAPAGGFLISEFSYSTGKIVITDGTFTGTWASKDATSWTVVKNGASS